MSAEMLAHDTRLIAEAVATTTDELDIISCLEGHTPNFLPINHFKYGSNMLNAFTLVAQSSADPEYYGGTPPEITLDDPTRTALGGMLAVALAPRQEIRADIPDFQIGKARNLAVCPDTEGNFLKSLEIEEPPRYGDASLRYQKIVVDEHGQPILFQQSVGAKTSLTLTATKVDGREYPAGTVVKAVIDPDCDVVKAKKTGIDNTTLLVVEKQAVKFVQPGRLTEFAFDLYERPLVFTAEVFHEHNGYTHPTTDVTLDQIRDKVASLL
ncbi:MAG: hypothetical protein AAB423_00825 [Patescibacteria group bacterium]